MTYTIYVMLLLLIRCTILFTQVSAAVPGLPIQIPAQVRNAAGGTPAMGIGLGWSFAKGAPSCRSIRQRVLCTVFSMIFKNVLMVYCYHLRPSRHVSRHVLQEDRPGRQRCGPRRELPTAATDLLLPTQGRGRAPHRGQYDWGTWRR